MQRINVVNLIVEQRNAIKNIIMRKSLLNEMNRMGA